MTRIAVTDDLETCHALRRQVFIDEQGIAEPEEWDDLDGAAIHVLALDGTVPLGTARILPAEGRIGRVCVVPEARGTGLGAALIRFSMGWLKTQGAESAVLGAQCQAAGFYAKLGFAPEGAVYDDAGIPHQEMRCLL